MPEYFVQDIAQECLDVSHRVRLACQEFNIPISVEDTIEIYDTQLTQIKDHVKKQNDNFRATKIARDKAACKEKDIEYV